MIVNPKEIAQGLFYMVFMLGLAAHAEDKGRKFSDRFTKPITFKFLDEAGAPIDGAFTLHQTNKGKFVRNWHRLKPLDENGEITITEFPPEFEFGVTSNNEFYEYWGQSSDLDPKKVTYLQRCSPSGAMKFQITKFPQKRNDIPPSLVVEYHRKQPDGRHKLVKGIGIFSDGPEYTVGGLEPGEYFIAIKFEYEDKKPIFRSDPFQIKLKEYAILPKIEITKSAILFANNNTGLSAEKEDAKSFKELIQKKFDADHDGALTGAEKEEAVEFLQKMDSNGDSSISEEEQDEAIRELKQMPDPMVFPVPIQKPLYLKTLRIDFTNKKDAQKKAFWSPSDKMDITKQGLGRDGDPIFSIDGWIQTMPMALGLSWRAPYNISVRVTIPPPPIEIVLDNGQRGIPYVGDVYVRYSPDLKHWSSWKVLEHTGSLYREDKKEPGRHYTATIRVPYRERSTYTKLLSDYAKLDVTWKSDEEAAVHWILSRQPEFFSINIPFIGYVEFLFEGSIREGQRIKFLKADVSYLAMDGSHIPPKDTNAYKDRDSSPWRFKAEEKRMGNE